MSEMSKYDWQICHSFALLVLERFAEAVDRGAVGDGDGFDFIAASAGTGAASTGPNM